MSESWLVATDFSSCSDLAVTQAARLAACTGGELILLHAHSVPAVNEQFQTGEATFGEENKLKEKLEKMADKLKSDHDGLQVKFDVVGGAPAKTILEESSRLNVDHIVVGTHGRTGLSHVLLGSVAEKVVHGADRPVMVVREVGA